VLPLIVSCIYLCFISFVACKICIMMLLFGMPYVACLCAVCDTNFDAPIQLKFSLALFASYELNAMGGKLKASPPLSLLFFSYFPYIPIC
jgi:hypothetical protein